MVIKGLGRVSVPTAAGRPGAGRTAFSMGAAATAAPAKLSATAALDGLLLLQEAIDAPTRDRRARQHGRALLDALARLQLSLLGSDSDSNTLRDLAALAESCPEAADPALTDALGAIVLRAHVELARRAM